MIERQYCASAYTIDFEKKLVLLVYNEKLSKWLQPGGHIEGFETPIEAAIRETLEESGIEIQVKGPTFDNVNYEPISVRRYINKVGDMIDIQYLAIPLTTEINSKEGKDVRWFSLDRLMSETIVDEEIKTKVLTLYNRFK